MHDVAPERDRLAAADLVRLTSAGKTCRFTIAEIITKYDKHTNPRIDETRTARPRHLVTELRKTRGCLPLP